MSFPDHVWVFLHEFRSLQGEAIEEFRRNRRTFERVIEQILQDGVDAGEFEVKNARLTSLGWLGLHNYIYIWFHESGSFTPEEVAECFSDIFLLGVSARRLAGAAADDLFAQSALEHLPGCVAWEVRLPHDDPRRDLEVRQPFAREPIKVLASTAPRLERRTTATTSSPRLSSGAPTTATSSTSGCSSSAASTSAQ